VYRVLSDEARLTTMIERCRIAPWGFGGGADGEQSAVWLERDGVRRQLRGKGTVDLRRDDVVIVETAGGGGWGSAS
jgi:N-methylhydantoinase B/oxoprolinase/acetone carboxylase alpha subunit